RGRVLRAVCATSLPYVTATRLAVRVGQLFALAIALVGLAFNPMLLVLAAFVAFAAETELYGVIAAERETQPLYGQIIDAVRVAPGKYRAAWRTSTARPVAVVAPVRVQSHPLSR
ncbi:MAG: hypothetical protein KDB27_29555, partial [Planctomycetales bacterium]|nr:hypothetical protein [Planctomycetales bacterium]